MTPRKAVRMPHREDALDVAPTPDGRISRLTLIVLHAAQTSALHLDAKFAGDACREHLRLVVAARKRAAKVQRHGHIYRIVQSALLHAGAVPAAEIVCRAPRPVIFEVVHHLPPITLINIPEECRCLLDGQLSPEAQQLSYRAKQLLTELSSISVEIAQMVVSGEDNKPLPDWFLVELVRELPALVKRRNST